MPTEDYAYLTWWKLMGLGDLPLIPPEAIISPYVNRFIIAFRRSTLHLLGLPPGDRQRVEIEALRNWWPTFEPRLAAHLQDTINRDILQDYGRRALEAIAKVRVGGNREQALRDWGIQNLPETRGGHIPFTRNTLTILRHCYIELQNCIKEVRRINNLPLKQVPDYNRQPFEELTETCAWLEEIFEKDEIPLLVNFPSVGECALEILHRRLCNIFPDHKLSKRTLKALLKPHSH